MLKRGIEGDFASRLDDADYRESDYQKLKEGKEDADAVENTRELAMDIAGLIDGVFETKDAKQKYSDLLEDARNKGVTKLEALRGEIEKMEEALKDYRELFNSGDTRVWSEKSIKEYMAWVEQFNPKEIQNKAIKPWRESQYLPRKRVLDQYDAFPDKLKSKGSYSKFLELGFTGRKEVVQKMMVEQQKEFYKLVENSSFSKLDKNAAKRQFDAAFDDVHNPDDGFRGIEQRTFLMDQFPEQMKVSDNQQREFKEINKKIGKYAKGKEKAFSEHFEKQRFIGRTECVGAADKLLKYCEKLDQKKRDKVISEKTFNEFVEWAAVDMACTMGVRGMDLAHDGFAAEMADRERLKMNFDHYCKRAEGIMPKDELKKLVDRFYDKEAGNTERTEAFHTIRANYQELTEDLGLNELVNHSARGFAEAADGLYAEAMRIEDVPSRDKLLKIAKGSYEKIGEFAKDVGNQSLFAHVEEKIKEIDGLLNFDGSGESGVNLQSQTVGLSEEKKEKLKLVMNNLLSSSEEQRQELLRINLMQGILDHAHKKSMEAGEDSQAKRAENELDKSHHKRLHKGLKKHTENDGSDHEMMLDKEGQSKRVAKINIREWGLDDSEGLFQEEGEAMREQLILGDDSKIDSSSFKFENEKGEELKYEEARSELGLRIGNYSKKLVGGLIDNEDVKDVYREVSDSDQLGSVLAQHLSRMIEDGAIEADLNRVQVSS